jgi:hypothetical protein
MIVILNAGWKNCRVISNSLQKQIWDSFQKCVCIQYKSTERQLVYM